jgi:hypothetical protein
MILIHQFSKNKFLFFEFIIINSHEFLSQNISNDKELYIHLKTQ